jgi:hypothetical protein
MTEPRHPADPVGPLPGARWCSWPQARFTPAQGPGTADATAVQPLCNPFCR